MLEFWTAQYRYPGPERLDITVKGKDDFGRYFAPTWTMVQELKSGARTPEEYIEQYHKHITKMYAERKDIFDILLARKQVVLVCFCPYGEFCHRVVLASYLQQLGARYHGEITDFSLVSKKPDVIDEFKGTYHWLSNFAHCKFHHQGQMYLSVEHFYQAQKCAIDEVIKIEHPTNSAQKIEVNARQYIATCDNPKKAVRKHKIKAPENWKKESIAVMRTGLEYKFIANPHYRKLLAATEDIPLLEGNLWHDNFWGDCRCHTDLRAHYKKPECAEQGKNNLGKLIMEIRELI